jgi:hypothetical protein
MLDPSNRDPSAELLGMSGERERETQRAERDAAMRDEQQALLRNRRRMRGQHRLQDILPALLRNPLSTVFVATCLILFLSWTGYIYHHSYHRFFGNFALHEKYLCREEPLMLSLQKLMLQKAKREVEYMVRRTDGSAKSKAGVREVNVNAAAEATTVKLFDPKSYTFTEMDANEVAEAERIKVAQKELRAKHADAIGPAHPRPNVLDHRQRSKMKGLQLNRHPATADAHPDSKVFVSNDLGFYQQSFGAVNVETESGATLIGQSVGTHARSGNGFSTIVYYRIYKNANDYIRGLLSQFARNKEVRDGIKPECANLKDCRHLPEKRLSSGIKGFFFPAHLRRYPFTFVRNPLTRFVSAYTEVEYRYKDAEKEREWWEAHHREKKKTEVQDNERGGALSDFSTEQSITSAKRAAEKAEKARQAKMLNAARSVPAHKRGAQQAQVIKSKLKKTLEFDQFGAKSDAHEHLAHKALPLRAPLGSAKRVLEFIDMILMFDGSRRLFRTYDQSSELTHIAPQIGTLFAAAEHEALPIRTFQIEAFSDNWKSLSEEVAQPRLLQVREVLKNHTGLWQHRSSADEHGTSRAAWSLLHVGMNITAEALAQAEADEKDRLAAARLELEERRKARVRLGLPDATDVEGKGAGSSDTVLGELRSAAAEGGTARKVSDAVDVTGYPKWLTLQKYLVPEVVYTRALCRIYLADFVCGDYALPPVCRDILEEVDAFSLEYESKQRAEAWASRSLAQTLLPKWLLYVLAEVPCSLFADSPPSCIASFVHGEALHEEDEYDEWGSDHDEL